MAINKKLLPICPRCNSEMYEIVEARQKNYSVYECKECDYMLVR